MLSLRRCCRKQYPNWCLDARSVLRVALGPHACYARAKGVRGGALAHVPRVGAAPPPAPASFAPPFVHQLFPGDMLFGYRASGAAPVALRVWVREPELSMCVTGEAPGGALEGEVPVRLPLEREGEGSSNGSGGGKSMCLRAGKDDILEMLGAVLPRHFPAASFATAVGAEACSPLAAPLALRFFPAAEEGGGGGSAPWAPPGRCIHTYTRGAAAFAVHQWSPAASPELLAYHARLATLAMWLIENASAIDSTDPRWDVLSVYQTGGGEEEEEDEEEEEGQQQQQQQQQGAAAPAPEAPAPEAAQGGTPGSARPPRAPALVGFCTVYRFTNPMREQRPHSLRLAQLLCLPRFQRAGHGGELLGCIHAQAEADGGGEGVLEVSVEDPCEGMARLRDAHDVARAAARGLFAAHPAFCGGSAGAAPLPPLEAIVDLTEAEVAGVVRELRVTAAQARRCYLALLLARLALLGNGGAGGGVSTSDAPHARAYRLLVKRVIYNGDADIRAVGSEVRKAALERGFVQAVASFAGALARCAPPLALREDAAAAQQRWAAVQREQELELEASEHAQAVEKRLAQ